MAIVVNTHDQNQEQELLSFLADKNYDYKANPGLSFTEKQAEEILGMNIASADFETSARSWEEIRKELKSNVINLIREAGIDIQTPCYWYENPHIGLAGKLLKEIDDYFDLLGQNPMI